jgi:hypothetical protein
MVWRRLTESLQLKNRHFKWVPYKLTDKLRQKRIEGVRTILNVLEAPQRIGFCDIITGDESWIYLNMTPNSILIGAEEIPPTRPRTTTASKTALLTVCWGIRGVRLVNWLPHGASLMGPISMKIFSSRWLLNFTQARRKSIARGHCSIWIMRDRTYQNGIWLEWKN